MKKAIIIILLALCSQLNAQTYFDGTSLTAGGAPYGNLIGIKQVPKAQLFSTLFDAKSVNTAIPGSCMERSAKQYAKSGYDKIATLPKFKDTSIYFVEFGGNDILFGSPYSTAGFMRDYNLYIQKLIANGKPARKICIMYNIVPPAAGMAFYNKKFGSPIADKNRINRYNEAILAVIKFNKTDSFNIGGMYDLVPQSDWNKLFTADSLHPSALGHWYIAQALIAKFKAKQRVIIKVPVTVVRNIYDTQQRVVIDTIGVRAVLDTVGYRDSIVTALKTSANSKKDSGLPQPAKLDRLVAILPKRLARA